MRASYSDFKRPDGSLMSPHVFSPIHSTASSAASYKLSSSSLFLSTILTYIMAKVTRYSAVVWGTQQICISVAPKIHFGAVYGALF